MFGEAIIEGNDSVTLFFAVSLFYMKIYMHPAYWIKIEKWYNQTAVWEETEIWYTADETIEQPHLHWLQFIFFESFIFDYNAVQSFSLKLYRLITKSMEILLFISVWGKKITNLVSNKNWFMATPH